MTLDASSGISSANRLTFCQSIASSRSNLSPSDSRGWLREPYQRRRFAAADLRPAGANHDSVQTGFRGSVEQQRSRRHHAAAAAARERDRDARVRAARARPAPLWRLLLWLLLGTSSLLPRFTFCQVNRLRAEFGLTQIKAIAIPLLHHVKLKYVLWYCNTIIAFGSRWVKPHGRVWNGAKACAQPDAGGQSPMSIEAHRWLMTAVNAPLERAAFSAGARARRGRRRRRRMRRLPHRPRIPLRRGTDQSAVAADAGSRDQRPRRRSRSRRRSLAGEGGDRSCGPALRRMRSLPPRPLHDLPLAEDARQRHPGGLRHAYRRSRPRLVCGRRVAARPARA